MRTLLFIVLSFFLCSCGTPFFAERTDPWGAKMNYTRVQRKLPIIDSSVIIDQPMVFFDFLFDEVIAGHKPSKVRKITYIPRVETFRHSTYGGKSLFIISNQLMAETDIYHLRPPVHKPQADRERWNSRLEVTYLFSQEKNSSQPWRITHWISNIPKPVSLTYAENLLDAHGLRRLNY